LAVSTGLLAGNHALSYHQTSGAADRILYTAGSELRPMTSHEAQQYDDLRAEAATLEHKTSALAVTALAFGGGLGGVEFVAARIPLKTPK
jgi:hypothetical protein